MKHLIYILLFGLISTTSYAQLASYNLPLQLKFSPTASHLKKMNIKEVIQRTNYFSGDSVKNTSTTYIDCILQYDSLSNLHSFKWDFRKEFFAYHPIQSHEYYYTNYNSITPTDTFSFGNTNLYLNPLDSNYYNFTEERFYWEENKLVKTETIYQKLESDVPIPDEQRLNMQLSGFLPFVTFSNMPDDFFKITFTTNETKKFYDDGLLVKEELVVDGQLIKTTHYTYSIFNVNNQQHKLLTQIEEKLTDYPAFTNIEYSFYE